MEFFKIQDDKLTADSIKIVTGARGTGKNLAILDRIYKTHQRELYNLVVYRFQHSMKYDMWDNYQAVFKREDLKILKRTHQVIDDNGLFSDSCTLSYILAKNPRAVRVENVILSDDILYYCRTPEEVKDLTDLLTECFPYADIWYECNPYCPGETRKLASIAPKSNIIPFDVQTASQFLNAIYGRDSQEITDEQEG